MNLRLNFAKYLCFSLVLFVAGAVFAGPTKDGMVGPFPYKRALVGIPEGDFVERILPGYLQRARAMQILTNDFYTDQSILEKFPEWKKVLESHPGFWPELVGHVGDKKFARLFGPDVWVLKDGRTVVGESNGGNVGGAEYLMYIEEDFSRDARLGALPYNADLYDRWANHLIKIAEESFGTGKKPVIVVADEASITKGMVSVKDLKGGDVEVEAPFSVGPKLINFIRGKYKEVGVEWVSLVDDKGRLFVKDGTLYLADKSGNNPQKVDVLLTLGDVESLDPLHEPQRLRNIKAHRPDLNKTALLTGIPGLVDAWMNSKYGNGFIWVNNPTSTLSRSKIWPAMIDRFMNERLEIKPTLPVIETIVLFDENGKLNEPLLNDLIDNHINYVFKLALGDGGKQVYIMDEIAEAERSSVLQQIESWARENPYSVIANPRVQLDQISLRKRGEEEQKWYFDIRPLGLISGAGNKFSSTVSRNTMVRISPNAKVNISGGGSICVGTPYKVKEVSFLSPIRSIGVQQVTFPHILGKADHQKFLQDGRERALVEGYLIRDLYRNPEKLFTAFPVLEHLLPSNAFYRPKHFQSRSDRYPSIMLSGPDYLQTSDGSYVTIEHNPTYAGGLLRLWRLKMPGVKREMNHWFKALKAKSGVDNPYSVYFVDQSRLGDDWERLRADFRRDFNVELAGVSEVEGFHVKDDRLYFQGDDGVVREVNMFFSYIEPDFIDPEVATDPELLRIMSRKSLMEYRERSIPGLHRAIRAGNLLVVNESGHDMVNDKALLSLMPDLRRYYLGKDEIIPTIETRLFIDSTGKLNRAALEYFLANSSEVVVKDRRSTGGAGGVIFPSDLSSGKFRKLVRSIKERPDLFLFQPLIDPRSNELGFRTEVRPFSVVEFDYHNDTEPSLFGQVKTLYGKGANEGQRTANITPTKKNTPGFFVRTKPCVSALRKMGKSNKAGKSKP